LADSALSHPKPSRQFTLGLLLPVHEPCCQGTAPANPVDFNLPSRQEVEHFPNGLLPNLGNVLAGPLLVIGPRTMRAHVAKVVGRFCNRDDLADIIKAKAGA